MSHLRQPFNTIALMCVCFGLRISECLALAAGLGRLRTNTFRHTFRTWLDSVGTPVGVQQRLICHADIGTTMNLYGDAVTADTAEAHGKVVGLALNGLQTDCEPR